MDIVGTIVSGRHAKILIRQKSDTEIELGDLLVAESEKGGSYLLQVYDLEYGSQLSGKNLEMISGMKLEGITTELDFMDPTLRNYLLATSKAVLRFQKTVIRIPKTLPSFMREIRHVTAEDLKFLTKPPNPVYTGKVRSGSKLLDVDVFLNGDQMLTHHVLVPATTGRGKSNLVKVMLWSILNADHFGSLVLDPHDEYYGRHGKGLKDHPHAKQKLLYYSPSAISGTNSLVINLQSIKPWHFRGIVKFTDAQLDAITLYYNHFRDEWVERIIQGEEIDRVDPRTLSVIQRKFDNVLGIYLDNAGNLQCRSGIFSEQAGQTTIKDIVASLEQGKTVIVDTSRLRDEAELLIGGIVVSNILGRYQHYKFEGKLLKKPVITVVIEEAPRVLGGTVLEKTGENIYSTIAREGRKFRIGLLAVTQLTSVIPRDILTNMNTKIILGNEMGPERQAIINSAAQDLSEDSRAIASLDVGEAIISSVFTKFAVPIQIPLFEDFIKKPSQNKEPKNNDPQKAFHGVDLE